MVLMNNLKDSVDVIPEGLENECLIEEGILHMKKLIKSLLIYTLIASVISITSIILKLLKVERSITMIFGVIAIVPIIFIVIRITLIYKEIGKYDNE